jgi:hypothetical protein
MSAGSPIVNLRIPVELLDAIDAEIARTNQNIRNAPFSRSSWLIVAIREKIAKSLRSRKNKKKKPVPIVRADD